MALILKSLKKSSVKILVGLYTGSETRISSPGLTTLNIARKTEPKPVGVRKTWYDSSNFVKIFDNACVVEVPCLP